MPRNGQHGKAPLSIGAAECAARTGLSVRALHVYEQQQLIKPLRTANGWRRFSATDLSRLNTIIVLKSLGLRLSEIRAQLTTRSPSLEEVLRIQSETWKARRTTAEAAIKLVDGALNHVKMNRALHIDQLCALVRMFEMNNDVPGLKRRIAKYINPNDSQAWSQWWAEHPDDLAESICFAEAQSALLRKLRALMESGVRVNSVEVRTLMTNWEALFLRHRIRERAVRQMEWNYDVTLKWYMVGHRTQSHEEDWNNHDRERTGLYTPKFATFVSKAHEHSGHGRAINAVHQDIAKLIAEGAGPSSEGARKVASRFAKACTVFLLGNPLIHARFARFIERVNHGTAANLARENAWHFLQQALEASAARRKPTCALQ